MARINKNIIKLFICFMAILFATGSQHVPLAAKTAVSNIARIATVKEVKYNMGNKMEVEISSAENVESKSFATEKIGAKPFVARNTEEKHSETGIAEANSAVAENMKEQSFVTGISLPNCQML